MSLSTFPSKSVADVHRKQLGMAINVFIIPAATFSPAAFRNAVLKRKGKVNFYFCL